MASTLPTYGAGSTRHSGTTNVSPWRQRAMGWLLLLVLLGLLFTSRHLKAENPQGGHSTFFSSLR